MAIPSNAALVRPRWPSAFATLGRGFRVRVRLETGFLARVADPVRREEDADVAGDGYRLSMDRRLNVLVWSPWTVPVLVLAFSQWEVWVDGPTHLLGPRWAASASLGAGSLLLAGRRRAPLTTQIALACVTCVPWFVWGASEVASSFLLGVVATYGVGRWGRRPAAYLGIPMAAAWALLQIARDPLQAGIGAGWGWALYAVVAWVAGVWVRQSSELGARRDAEQRARSRAELAEQRLGIARDLHDVLANSLGVMVVHAEAAEEVLAQDPDRAAQAMRRVQSSGREALREVRAVLGPLRAVHDPQQVEPVPRPGAASGQAPRHLAPDLGDVAALVDRMRAAGLPVVVTHLDGRALPPPIGEVAYRVLQESLTNIVRHAGLVDTRVRLDVTADALTIEVSDRGGKRPITRSSIGGHGLTGMSERVHHLGGTLHAGPQPDHGFVVRVDIPLSPESTTEFDRPRALDVDSRSELPR